MSKTFYYILIGITLITILWFGYRVVTKEDVIIYSTTSSSSTITRVEPPSPQKDLFRYIEIMNGCDPYFVGDCVNMRSGPGIQYPVVVHLRTGVVLKVDESVNEPDGVWYKILFSNELLYPERVVGSWYVKAEFARLFSNEGNQVVEKNQATTTKRIVVDVSEQKLYAYNNGILFMEEFISTGLEFTPTPKGKFSVFKMTPSRFMQGPIPGVSDQVYDLPGVPWNLYFTEDGAVIHGAYWHNHFGKPWSHGCVNLSPQNAKKLYDWAEIGTEVVVQK